MPKTPLRPLRRFLTYANVLGGFPLELDKDVRALNKTLVLLIWCMVIFSLIFVIPFVVAGIILGLEGGLNFREIYFPQETDFKLLGFQFREVVEEDGNLTT